MFALFWLSMPSLSSARIGRWLAMTLWPFTLATACLGFQIWWTVTALVDHRAYPGGPDAWIMQHGADAKNVVLNVL